MLLNDHTSYTSSATRECMRQIILLQGVGNNEQGWAKLLSQFGRVVLVQQALICHTEIWEGGQCIYSGPEKNVANSRRWDDRLLGVLTILRSLRACWEHSCGEKIDLIISSGQSMTLPALLLRLLGKTRKVVCVLTDYLPPRGSFAVRIHRRFNTWLTRWVARHADEVWAVSPRIPMMQANPRNFVVPLCINENTSPPGAREEIGYIGFPSADHALDLLFEICRRHGLKLNIIGSSPYLESIKHLAPPGTTFHGLLNDSDKIQGVLSRCCCGYAVYRNTSPQSYSYFGIPSKTLAFFASNTPVVTTNTAHFTQYISQFGVGHVIEPVPDQIEKAVLDLKAHSAEYSQAINRFRAKWNADVQSFHQEHITTLLSGQ